MKDVPVSICWFRRDLRLSDHRALESASSTGHAILCLFIFDEEILGELDRDDARVTFIHSRLQVLHEDLRLKTSSLLVRKGSVLDCWKDVLSEFDVRSVHFNRDYEPYARERDGKVTSLLEQSGISVHACKDQVIFEAAEILKSDGTPYTVFTPYKKRWLERFREKDADHIPVDEKLNFLNLDAQLPALEELSFQRSEISVPDFDLNNLDDYEKLRDIPAADSTSHLSPHLRFGTVSIREVVRRIHKYESFLSELIWREFFMQILFHFPRVVNENFHRKYDGIQWLNNESDFDKWRHGMTGFPLVDAGMRQLNRTGNMHNRVRMIAAGFLCKHLLIDWRRGEAYFARKLLDYDLSSNNGNWQWAAGTGCDAAPYFRVFNPERQLERFDKDLAYVKKWLPEYGSDSYPEAMVEHSAARDRAIEAYKKGFSDN